MSIGEEFVLWLRDQMTARNWSQSDLAKASGISKQAISNILNQTRAPGPEVCISIAKALNLDPQFVFIKAGLFPESQEDESTLVREIKYKISMLSEEKLQFLLDIVDAFLVKNRAAHVVADKKEAYKTKKE